MKTLKNVLFGAFLLGTFGVAAVYCVLYGLASIVLFISDVIMELHSLFW